MILFLTIRFTIKTSKKTTLKFFKSKKYIVDSSLMEEAKELKGLKKLLEEKNMTSDDLCQQIKEVAEDKLLDYYTKHLEELKELRK